MSDRPARIKIEITGEDEMVSNAIGDVIWRTLNEKGFDTVGRLKVHNFGTVYSGMDSSDIEPKSVLDMVQAARPDLFRTPIAVQTNFTKAAESTPNGLKHGPKFIGAYDYDSSSDTWRPTETERGEAPAFKLYVGSQDKDRFDKIIRDADEAQIAVERIINPLAK